MRSLSARPCPCSVRLVCGFYAMSVLLVCGLCAISVLLVCGLCAISVLHIFSCTHARAQFSTMCPVSV
eukprot:3792920-Rhodomonas_salina.1